MGRKRVILTEEQIKERNARYWGPDRNLKRKERYQTDEAYRASAIQQVRQSYRTRREQDGAAVRDDDCRVNLRHLASMATMRQVSVSGRLRSRLTLSVEQMGKALLRNTQVVYRWIKAGMFPAPTLAAYNSGIKQAQPVYTLEEAAALINVMGEHQSQTQYYREVHAETREKIFDAVRDIRQARETMGHEREHSDDSHAAAA